MPCLVRLAGAILVWLGLSATTHTSLSSRNRVSVGAVCLMVPSVGCVLGLLLTRHT